MINRIGIKLEIRRYKMKRGIVVIIIAVVLVVGVGSYFIGVATGEKAGSKQVFYKNPEDAILAYVDGLNEKDISKMSESFGVAVKQEYFSFETLVEWLRSVSPGIGMPGESDFAKEMNSLYFAGDMFAQTKLVILSLNLGYNQFETLLIDDVDVDEFTEAVDDMSEIEVTGIYRYEAYDDDDNHQEYIETISNVYDAESLIDCLVVFEYEGDEYILGLGLYEYDKGFIISRLASPVLGTSLGIVEPLDSQWQEIIDDECEELYKN